MLLDWLNIIMHCFLILCLLFRTFSCTVEFPASKKHCIITGDNGSGKSSILVGADLAMGAKAKDAARHGTMEGHISRLSSDGTPCYAEVVLCNKGPNSYKNAEYGDFIHLRRDINKGGSSSLYVRKKDGTKLNMNDPDVTEMMKHFHIPSRGIWLPILQQNCSAQLAANRKSFRNNGNKMYEIVAEQMEWIEMKKDLEGIESNLIRVRIELDRVRKECNELEKVKKDIEKKYEQVRELETKAKEANIDFEQFKKVRHCDRITLLAAFAS